VTNTRQGLQIVISSIIDGHKLKKIGRWSLKTLGLEAVRAEFKRNRNIDDVIHALRQDARIESVHPIRTYHLLNYNDPYFKLQNTIESNNLEKVHRYATGKDVSVGVVDTGIDRTHPELAGRIIYSSNSVVHDQFSFDDDEHGTAVAGVIGSAANNDLGIVGVAPDVKLMIFKACSEDNQTRRASCDSVSLMKALLDVLRQKPDVLNLSLAGPEDTLLTLLIKAALAEGIIVVAAVDGKNSKHKFPASIPGVLAVNTLTQFDVAFMPKDGVLAPGLELLTTTPGATYAFRSGSSMSAAYVSGVAALLKERDPGLSARQLILNLHSTSHESIMAVPMVDVCHAVVRVEDGEVCTIEPIGMLDQETVKITSESL
jgi:subtilisin family serine protease